VALWGGRQGVGLFVRWEVGAMSLVVTADVWRLRGCQYPQHTHTSRQRQDIQVSDTAWKGCW
jgi:hypothetical protein